MRFASPLIFLLLFSRILYAQTTFTVTNGPTWVNATTNLDFVTVNIAAAKPDEDVTVNGSLTFANSNARTLTVTDGILIVKGDVTFNAGKSNAGLSIASGASMIVFGNLNLGKNHAEGAVEGKLVVLGNITALGTGGDFTGGGTVYSNGTNTGMTVGNSGGKVPIENLETDDVDIFEYIENGGNVPLPVNLLSFDLEVNNGVKASWSTVSEKDNDYFVLERSEDGKSFYPIAEIGGNGTTQTLSTYEYTDYSPEANVSFYRLLQVDYDGAFEYFPAKRIQISNATTTNSVDIYPTLVTQGKASLVGAYPLYIENAYLYDLKGGKVDNVKSNLTSEGIFRYSLDVSDLKNGAYILKFIDTKGESFTKKFVIQN